MKWWEWVFSGIGVLGLGLLIGWLRRRSHSSGQQATVTAQGARISDSPVASGTGITQNSPTIINLSLPAAQETEKEEEEEKEETAKVDFIQPRYVLLHESGYAIWHEAVSNLESARTAVVAEFKNNPKPLGQKTVKAGSVTASMVYRGKGNPEELHVSHGAWLDEYTHFASFPSGKTHSLIIALKLVPFVALKNPRSIDPRSRFTSGQTIHHAQPVVLPAKEGELEITLVDGRGVTVYHGLFDYDFSSADTASLKVK
jgi:hypothetical protein